MPDTRQAPHISRRTLLKIMAAAGGSAAASAMLPGKWVKPVMRVGVLPAHAQSSLPPAPTYQIAGTTVNPLYGDGCVADLSVTISPATAGIEMQVEVCNPNAGCQTLTATTDATGKRRGSGQQVVADLLKDNPRRLGKG